ncbi:MAG: sulfotransferase family 2 domain-containing protein [Bacteroidetes bacterium]|nr:sulfotransferase family 2 domain-containing protein [Bacteroidota bacterium]
MIISVHMPKSGGASFRHLLENHFKKGYLQDHDYPIHDPRDKRHRKVRWKRTWNRVSDTLFNRYQNVECIHGHFLPYKYEEFYQSGDHTFVTWLRDPLERLTSHYYYWKEYHDKMDQQPLLKKFLEENWSFEDFAFSEEVRNIYSLFLWKFPVERFKFIGITEFYNEDLTFFAENFLDKSEVSIPKKNVNKKSKEKKTIDRGLEKEIKEFHANDYQLYEYALKQRSKR